LLDYFRLCSCCQDKVEINKNHWESHVPLLATKEKNNVLLQEKEELPDFFYLNNIIYTVATPE